MEDGERWDRALREYVELAIRSRGGEVATIGLAWVLRKLGRADEARKILAPLADGPEPPPFAVFDMASIELERGNSEQAERLLRMMEFDDATAMSMFSPTLITLCLRGNGVQARRLGDKLTAPLAGATGSWT